MLQSSSGRKWKKCEQTLLFIAIHYWGYTSLEVKGQWRLLLPPCFIIVVQQPGTSSPPSQLKRSSVGIIWMHGQGLHQQLLSSAMAQYNCLLHGRWTMAEDRSCLWRRSCTSWWYPRRSILTDMEDYKFLVVGSLWWGGREGGAILTNLWSPMTCILSSIWL